MDANRLTPYPHLTWLTYGLRTQPPRAFMLDEYRATAHRLFIIEEGDADFSSIIRGIPRTTHVCRGSLVFCPASFCRHSLGITTAGGWHGRVLLMPSDHLHSVSHAEGARAPVGARVLHDIHDAALFASALRLVSATTCGHVAEDVGAEIAARRLVIRLTAATGGRIPEWMKDTSVFMPSVMRQIVQRVDARLSAHPTLTEVSNGFGFSPSHFARKFQQSTGTSLNRFLNRRRVALSLALLTAGHVPLAQLSLDLGFSSQSHFTRLFSGLVGVAPHQFRRAQRRMGW